MSLNTTNKNFLTSYVNTMLLNRPYSDMMAQAMSRLSKWNYNNLYCSKWPWIAYQFAMQWDIDSDGWNIVKSIDILNSHYWYDYATIKKFPFFKK